MPVPANELVVRSPIDGSEIGRAPVTALAEMPQVIERSKVAFASWRLVPAPRRGELVRLLGEELRRDKDALAALVTAEAGKIVSEGQGEVQEMIDICDFAVGLSRQLHGLTIASERPLHRMMETWHPMGPCAVISAPTHVQDFPARYAPQMGFEGANVIFDTWVHPLMMGLEEHLLAMFRDDVEFHDAAAPSHLGGKQMLQNPSASVVASDIVLSWAADAEQELKKVPFFVRGKARRNTEKFAAENGLAIITVETLYDAKAHFAR